jgi:hypothetical protein
MSDRRRVHSGVETAGKQAKILLLLIATGGIWKNWHAL